MIRVSCEPAGFHLHKKSNWFGSLMDKTRLDLDIFRANYIVLLISQSTSYQTAPTSTITSFLLGSFASINAIESINGY